LLQKKCADDGRKYLRNGESEIFSLVWKMHFESEKVTV
jgi:hypothetical protein